MIDFEYYYKSGKEDGKILDKIKEKDLEIKYLKEQIKQKSELIELMTGSDELNRIEVEKKDEKIKELNNKIEQIENKYNTKFLSQENDNKHLHTQISELKTHYQQQKQDYEKLHTKFKEKELLFSQKEDHLLRCVTANKQLNLDLALLHKENRANKIIATERELEIDEKKTSILELEESISNIEDFVSNKSIELNEYRRKKNSYKKKYKELREISVIQSNTKGNYLFK